MGKKTVKSVIVSARSKVRGSDKSGKTATPKTKKITRTRSIQRTIEQGREYEVAMRKKSLKKALSERRADVQKKRNKPVAVVQKRKVTKVVPARAVATASSAFRASLPAPALGSSLPVPPVVLPPLPVPVAIPVTYSQPSRNKSTVLSAKDSKPRPLPAFGVIEVCFCIDATGSMSSYLAQAKSAVVSLISKIEEKVHSEGIELRFAVVTYRDHPPQDSTYVTRIQDFTNDKEIRDYINSLDAFGGGDEPEAVHDGLLDSANKISWTNTSYVPTVRYVFHIADAPAHGSEFLTSQRQKGCTCGISTDAVIHAINMKEIHYRLIKVFDTNPRLNEMGNLFKKFMTNYDETTIQKANELDVKVSDMVIRELIPDS